MALVWADIVKDVKGRIYNSGLGEKPSIRQTAAGTATVTGDLVDFAMDTGGGGKLRAGHVLSSFGAAEGDEYGFYVLSVSTDVATCVNGYDGEAIANSATMPVLLEHQAPVTEYQIALAINDIIEGYLYPELFDIVLDSFTPNFSTLQSNADPLDLKAIRAWQQIGGESYQVPIKLIDNMPTADFSSGKMLTYDVVTGGDIDYSAVRKISVATSSGTDIARLIAKGASALLVEGTEASTNWETAKFDAGNRGSSVPSRALWGSFFTAKRRLQDALAKESVREIRIDRG